MGANSDLTRRAREDIEAVRAALRFGIRLRRDSDASFLARTRRSVTQLPQYSEPPPIYRPAASANEGSRAFNRRLLPRESGSGRAAALAVEQERDSRDPDTRALQDAARGFSDSPPTAPGPA